MVEFAIGGVFALLSIFGVALYLLRWTRKSQIIVENNQKPLNNNHP